MTNVEHWRGSPAPARRKHSSSGSAPPTSGRPSLEPRPSARRLALARQPCQSKPGHRKPSVCLSPLSQFARRIPGQLPSMLLTLWYIGQDNPAGYEPALYSITGSCAKNQLSPWARSASPQCSAQVNRGPYLLALCPSLRNDNTRPSACRTSTEGTNGRTQPIGALTHTNETSLTPSGSLCYNCRMTPTPHLEKTNP